MLQGDARTNLVGVFFFWGRATSSWLSQAAISAPYPKSSSTADKLTEEKQNSKQIKTASRNTYCDLGFDKFENDYVKIVVIKLLKNIGKEGGNVSMCLDYFSLDNKLIRRIKFRMQFSA